MTQAGEIRAVSESLVSAGLYSLSEQLGQRNPDAQAHGFLGGRWGYGNEFSNDVFEMFPYWWGDCDCGFDRREAAWCEMNQHAKDCYQTELWRRVDAGQRVSDACDEMVRAWRLPEFGSAVHCTCGHQEKYADWRGCHDHDPRCSMVRPNFKHYASGLEVRWYKYIGRSMEIDGGPDTARWLDILSECMASVTGASAPVDKEGR